MKLVTRKRPGGLFWRAQHERGRSMNAGDGAERHGKGRAGRAVMSRQRTPAGYVASPPWLSPRVTHSRHEAVQATG